MVSGGCCWRALFATLVLWLLTPPAFAQPVGTEAEDVARVEAWIESIETLTANFMQVSPDGTVTQGDFYMRRPGLLRFQYDPPTPFLIIADGFSIHMWDRELDEATSWPILGTPLRVLLRRELDFQSNYLTVVQRSPGLLRLTLVERDAPDQGSLTLVFQERPFQLVQWVVIDAIGLTTVVGLSELVTGIELDGRLFTFDDPRQREEEEETTEN